MNTFIRFFIAATLAASAFGFSGCASTGGPSGTGRSWAPYKQLRLDPGYAKFNMSDDIVFQIVKEMRLRAHRFSNDPSGYFRIGYIGHDIAYDTSSFFSGNGAMMTVRDVYDTTMGQIVIEKGSYFFDDIEHLLFPIALVQFSRYPENMREKVLTDGYFDFYFKSPSKKQTFNCRIPADLARKHAAYIEAGKISEGTITSLAEEIVAALEF